MLTKSNALGYAVLSLIINKLNDDEARNLRVEPYLNGRENGFAVHFFIRQKCHDRKFVFSEQRGTDSIVIYEGLTHEFNMLGNGLNEKIYRSSKSFEYNKADCAAEYIVERLREIKTPT